MILASRLGMSLRECMEKHTYREYLAWMAFIEEEWNLPSRSDHYLMQISQEVRRVLSKKPNNIKLKHFKIQFGTEKQLSEREKQQITQSAKAHWFKMLNIKQDK